MPLTTLANVKTRLAIATTDATRDAALSALITSVTTRVEKECNRTFDQATVTEYPRVNAGAVYGIQLLRPPIAGAMTSLHLSTTIPRVYDSTTLLVEGTDYFVDQSSGLVRLVSSRCVSFPPDNAAKAVYLGGYSSIPTDIEDAVIATISHLYEKSGSFHLTSKSGPLDGQVGGVRFEIPNEAQEVFDRYRLYV